MSWRNFVINSAENPGPADSEPVFVDSVTQAVDVLWIYLRKTVDNVKLVLAQGKSNVLGECPVLQTKGFKRQCYTMKSDSLKRFVAVGKNMDFMAKISESTGQVHGILFSATSSW